MRSVGHCQADGVAEHQLLRELADALKKSLPTMAEIEAELAGEQSEAGGG